MTDQPRTALSLGNAYRLHQAELRRSIRAESSASVARERVAAVISNPQPSEAGMQVEALLRAIPRVGRKQALTMLAAADIVIHDCRVRDLTPLRRERLVAALVGERVMA